MSTPRPHRAPLLLLASVGLLGCDPIVIECDGVSDQTPEIQAAFDGADPGSVITFTTDKACLISDSIDVEKSLIITSDLQSTDRAELVRIDDGAALPRYKACKGNADGAIFNVVADDVSIARLRLTGAEYGPVGARNTHGIWAAGPDQGRIKHLTVSDVEMSKFRGRGVSLVRVDDFVVEHSAIEDAGYAGIAVEDSKRGRIHGNTVLDIGNPDVCQQAPECSLCDKCECQETAPGEASVYGIVVTGCTTETNCSEDIVISGNTVRENIHWAGIMNHGAQRVLIVDNLVEDAEILYANTVSAPAQGHERQASHETWFVNNIGDVLPKSMGGRYDPRLYGLAQWLVGTNETLTTDLGVIGNIYRNSGFRFNPMDEHVPLSSSIVFPVDDLTFTHNEFTTTTELPRQVVLMLEHFFEPEGVPVSNATFAHNLFSDATNAAIKSECTPEDILVTDNVTQADTLANITLGGTWTFDANSFVAQEVAGAYDEAMLADHGAPPAPTLTAVATTPGTVELRWDGYPSTTTTDHDSFFIADFFGGEFHRIAHRPANDPRWSFASSNPQYQAFDTLGYVAADLHPGEHWFMLRAQNGNAMSGWSVAQVFVN